MGAHHDGTGAQSAYGLEERVTDTRKGRSRERERGPLGVEEAANLMEDCLLAPHCIRKMAPPHWSAGGDRDARQWPPRKVNKTFLPGN
jgi:hypothetical protein